MGQEPTAAHAHAEATSRASGRVRKSALGSLAIVVGLLLLAVGGWLIATAQPAQTVPIDGSIANYTEIVIGGSYAHNELHLVRDTHTYTLDGPAFHPSLPARFLQYGRVRIWVTEGTTQVVAVTLYDPLGLNPATYATDTFEHPVRSMVEAQVEGAAASGLGLVIIVVAGVALRKGRLPRLSRAMSSSSRSPAAMPVAMGAGASGDQAQRFQAGEWDLTLFGEAHAGSATEQDKPDIPAPVDLIPTEKMPSVAPAMSEMRGDAMPDAPQPADSVDQLPTQKTPALSRVPPELEEDTHGSLDDGQEPAPPPPPPSAPDQRDAGFGVPQWGERWEARPPEGDAEPATEERSNSPDDAAPDAAQTGDVADEPTRRTPAVQPPERAEP